MKYGSAAIAFSYHRAASSRRRSAFARLPRLFRGSAAFGSRSAAALNSLQASFGRPDYDLQKAMRERLQHLLEVERY